jgi:DNA mismatch repair protein MSH4
MRHIEEARNATLLNQSIQLKNQICEGRMVIACATAWNLEFTVNVSTRNYKATLFGIPNETMTPMGGRLLHSNILQPLADERTIITRLYCAREQNQSEETLFSLRTSLKAFKDLDNLITSFIQVRKIRLSNIQRKASIVSSTWSTRWSPLPTLKQ